MRQYPSVHIPLKSTRVVTLLNAERSFFVCPPGQLYLDIDGEGFRLEETFEENPEPMEICMIAQDIIQAAQEKVTMMQLRDEDPDADL